MQILIYIIIDKTVHKAIKKSMLVNEHKKIIITKKKHAKEQHL